MERQYGFRERLLQVHRPDIRDAGAAKRLDQVEITPEYAIYIDGDSGVGCDGTGGGDTGVAYKEAIFTAAADLRDFLFISMGVPVAVKRLDRAAAPPENAVILTTEAGSLPCRCGGARPQDSAPLGSFSLHCEEGRVVVSAGDGRGALQGCFRLEDQMALARAPFVDTGTQSFSPAFSPRMTHSGYGLDWFPDEHLRAVAHDGMDSVLVFVSGPSRTPAGYMDFNELVYRARKFGLDVYAYSYMESLVHPDDPGALEYYRGSYGRLFAECPGFKGVVLVGESVEFPSKDKAVTGRRYFENETDGIPNCKPTAGWWPCADYPAWLEMVKRAVREGNPDADVVFWTYNWGYAPEPERLRLIESLPCDISLMATFEMFEERSITEGCEADCAGGENRDGGYSVACADYTISFEGPGKYFISEAQAAQRKGIRLYTQANSAGMTWDVGTVPYIPAPGQWIKRYEAMLDAREKYGLAGVMESHHYGYWPSAVSFVEKYMFTSPKADGADVLRRLAASLFGEDCAQPAMEAWRLWSEGIKYCVPTAEDQYGPLRIGPAYPLVFRSDVKIPAAPHARNGGNAICLTNYAQDGYYGLVARLSSLGGARPRRRSLEAEMRCFIKMRDCYKEGCDILEAAVAAAAAAGLGGARREELDRMLCLGRFIERCAETAVNVKRWNIVKSLVRAESDGQRLAALFAELVAIGGEEIENARRAIPLVRSDSRLGWEPTMEYIADEGHILWKIRQVSQVIGEELPQYMGNGAI